MDEITERICKHCDYLNLDKSLLEKTPKCGLSLDSCSRCMNCDVYLTTERLKSRIEYITGKIGPLFACGANGFVDTFMQQMPFDEDIKDRKRRYEKFVQTTLF